MDLPRFLNDKTFGNDRPRAPQALLYVPPRGSAVHCPTIEKAQEAAENYSAEHPGHTVAVYQLVGYAFRPVEAPEFTPASSEKAKAELLDCPPEGDDVAKAYAEEFAGSDLSPEQRQTMERMHNAMRGDG